ncbi:uncharacterized protein LOC130738759 [Lotus japonicus]|uniref:uncharacterized protein LOC130738759 n=1 Tax=Lotus japonicus TaxID=34305 RepID=UPI0025909C22|nr:uncharacterized protein LOC130738759 [Lotus japonicus]
MPPPTRLGSVLQSTFLCSIMKSLTQPDRACNLAKQECCRKNKENHSKQVIPHTGGSEANSRRRHEIRLVYKSSTNSIIAYRRSFAVEGRMRSQVAVGEEEAWLLWWCRLVILGV